LGHSATFGEGGGLALVAALELSICRLESLNSDGQVSNLSLKLRHQGQQFLSVQGGDIFGSAHGWQCKPSQQRPQPLRYSCTYLDTSFNNLVSTLHSGLPAVRDNEGGHGQGGKRRETPGYIAAYALHLTAGNIVLLGEAFKERQAI
jgi:hypothetical protein